jgi:hypothetical protein
MSRIITRKQWGSRGPKKRFTYLNKKRVVGIAVHHSGVKNGPKGVTAVKAFERHHMDANGWNAIAYNWLIDEEGVIYEGRGAGVVSAATRPYNSRTESICYTGDGDKDIPAETQVSLTWLIADIQKRYNNKLWVKGHRELASTSCPGNVLFDWVQAYRSGVKVVQPKSKPAPKKPAKTTRLVKQGSRGAHVKMMQTQLNKNGFKLAVDGIAGPQTIGALKKYQLRSGLQVDGLCGKQSWKALYGD